MEPETKPIAKWHKPLKCRICGEMVSAADRKKHRAEKHPDFVPPTRNVKVKLSAMERLRGIRLEIEQAIRDMEVERDNHQRKVLELDNQIAMYKKMLINPQNQHHA